jgi:hypothetical protein
VSTRSRTSEEVMTTVRSPNAEVSAVGNNLGDDKRARRYVERGSGDLYRIPKEALIPGASPAIVKESRGASMLLKLSEDPFITTFKARLLCAQHNVEANF